MAKARILNIVTTGCSPKDDLRFNKWYNEVHVPMLFKYKGMKKVTRYKNMDEKSNVPKYLAIYEYDTKESMAALTESPEFKAAIAEMQETIKSCPFEVKWSARYEPIQTWER
jgi:uncharacterized protein (TIGR02118 family)